MAVAAIMILNNQMGGEAMWFWYGTVFGHGAKLYSVLHTPLQPLFVLETSTWLRLFGSKLAVYEIPSVLHAFLLSLGIALILRESVWPAWQKAILLLGTFVLIVAGHSYRFDDYHVLAEAQITYAMLLLLLLGRPGGIRTARKELWLVAAVGVVSGLTFVTRITDGAALIIASAIALPFLVQRRKFLSLAVFGVVAALTVVCVVKLTGDSLAAYLSSSIFRAAGSKGGTSSILAAPFLVIVNTVIALLGYRQIAFDTLLLVAVGALTARFWRRGVRYLVPLQLMLAALLYLVAGPTKKFNIRRGLFFETLVLLATLLMYVVAVWIIVRYVRHRRGEGTWDAREVLIALPILEWASYSAGAAAEPLTNYYAPAALLLLLVAVVRSFGRAEVWVRPTLVTLLLLVAVNGLGAKAITPYSWQNYRYPPLFHGKTWYRHPVYGEMYIDRDLLQFSQRVCADIGAQPGVNQPELLSLPYPYPNYFCATPPWHNYVQTFFDTATRASVEHMMAELETQPPEWIVYQRQLNIMRGAERLYNHSKPIAQRDLDAMIMDKLTSGQWTLVDKSNYLEPINPWESIGTGWYIIRTRPPTPERPGLPLSVSLAAQAEGRRPEVRPGRP